MDVRIDETWDEGLARRVDLADALRQGLSHVADALDATVADDDGPAALDWTAAPIPDRDVEEDQRLIQRSTNDPVEGVRISSHESLRHQPVSDPQGGDHSHNDQDERRQHWNEHTPDPSFPHGPALLRCNHSCHPVYGSLAMKE